MCDPLCGMGTSFTAAQAAQKEKPTQPASKEKFTAAQAAQKCVEQRVSDQVRFTAAQAAQK